MNHNTEKPKGFATAEGATHFDLDGNSWVIPQPGHEDGTGLLWVDGLGWCSSEIGDAFIATLTPVLTAEFGDIDMQAGGKT